MSGKIYRTIIVVAAAALTGLLVVQVYWFVKAYDLQDKQFNEKVNLAMRAVSDKILTLNKDVSGRIDPVRQTASNTYQVNVRAFIPYAALDSVIRLEFRKHEVYAAFELALYAYSNDSLLLGGFYPQGIASDKPACLGRKQLAGPMNFAITFPDKHSDIMAGMKLWIISAFIFLLILFLFAYMIVDLSRQKKLAQLKVDFINNMTHEFQTPITNISMASEVLRAANPVLDTEKAAKYVNIIYQENQRLRLQVEQVLQTARLEKGELKLNKKKVDVNAIIQDVLANFQLRLQRKRGQVMCDLGATQSFVLGDYFHLCNLFYNLLDNAEKYSPGNPEITVTTANSEQGIRVRIADKGIGIRQEVQKFIFEKFYRAPAGNRHDIKGFGLGLTYVQQIVKEHEGVVTVTSEENKGSCFEVWFQNYPA
jgi:two-component system, OmpR family, phosphate regulon sensor histidine kinase PhoR